jgi:leucine-rich repeat protein SHOC2
MKKLLLLLICFPILLQAQTLLPLDKLESDEIPTYISIDKAYIEKQKAYKLKVFQRNTTIPQLIPQLPNLQALYMENLYFEYFTEQFGQLKMLQIGHSKIIKSKYCPIVLHYYKIYVA